MMNHKKVANATKWSIICEVIAKIIAPITTIILARLLSREFFGIVASLTAITSMADMLAEAGFNAYIVQHQFKDENERKGTLNICFWTNILISLFLFLIVLLNRDTFSRLVGADGYGTALAVMSFVIPMVSVSAIEMAIMKKDLNFKSLGFIKIISKLIPFVITIPMAMLEYGYWSLIIGSLSGEFVGMILCLYYGKFLPSLLYPIQYLKSIFSFSIWAYLESILEWLIANISTLVLAAIYGIGALGVFKVAVNLVTQITSSIYALYSNVYKSAIAKEQNDNESFQKLLLIFQKYSSMLSLPLGVLVFVYRDLVTILLLGQEWIEASTLIGLYCMTCILSIAFGNFYSDAIRAKGYPLKLVIIDTIYLSIIGILLYNAKHIPFSIFCIMFSIIKIVQPLLQIIVGRKVCRLKFRSIIKNSYPQIIASVCIAFMANLLGFTNLGPLMGILSIILLFVFYIFIVYLLSPEKLYYKNLIIRKLGINKL